MGSVAVNAGVLVRGFGVEVGGREVLVGGAGVELMFCETGKAFPHPATRMRKGIRTREEVNCLAMIVHLAGRSAACWRC